MGVRQGNPGLDRSQKGLVGHESAARRKVRPIQSRDPKMNKMKITKGMSNEINMNVNMGEADSQSGGRHADTITRPCTINKERARRETVNREKTQSNPREKWVSRKKWDRQSLKK